MITLRSVSLVSPVKLDAERCQKEELSPELVHGLEEATVAMSESRGALSKLIPRNAVLGYVDALLVCICPRRSQTILIDSMKLLISDLMGPCASSR